MRFALIIGVLVFICTQVMFARSETFVCQNGVNYIENECNSCFCSATGSGLGCTYKACFGPQMSRLRNCQVGTTSKSGCNKCWCVKDLGTICTNNKC